MSEPPREEMMKMKMMMSIESNHTNWITHRPTHAHTHAWDIIAIIIINHQ